MLSVMVFIRMTLAAHSCPVNASILGSLNNLQAYSAALAVATQSHSIRFTVSDGQGACPHNPVPCSVQAQLDAEASTRSAPGWLMSEGREAHSPTADQETSWAQVRGLLRHC